MKKQMFFSLVFFALVFTFTACNKSSNDEEIKEEPVVINDQNGDVNGTQVTFWDGSREYTYTDRNQYRDDLNASLDKLDKQIDMLEDRADNATGEAKESLENRIDKLEKQRSRISNKLNDWTTVTEEEWDNFKSDMNSGWTDIQDSYNEVARDLNIKDENY